MALGIPEEGYSCPCCESNYITAQVIAIDGGCRDNGKPNATSAIGVYFCEGSPFNFSRILGTTLHTNQKAELEACRAALEMVVKLEEAGAGFKARRYVIIKADSEYVVKGMTEWIYKWKENGYLNAKGKPVTNAPLFQRIDKLVEELEEEWALKVLFWHVPREQNREADALVNAAFDAA